MSDIKELLDVLSKQSDALQQLVGKSVQSYATTTGITQPGGPFSISGLSREVISAHVRPTGIANVLPLIAGNETDPRFGILTGVTDDVGDNPTYPCDNAPTGFIKGCNLTARFGFVSKSTNTIDWDKVSNKYNRGVFTDLVLQGRLLGMTNLIPSELNEGDVLNLVTMAEMVQAGIRLERELVTQTWRGSPAVATAGGGYIQFPGLALQISTGQVDADTNTTCPSADSDVKDFAYNNIDGTDGRDMYEYLSMLEYYLHFNAQRMGMLPATWAIAMRPDLWHELSTIWPCLYNTNKCGAALASGSNTTVQLQGTEMTGLTNAMREGEYIDINGRRYPVIVDDGINELDPGDTDSLSPGEYASSIFMVPLTITGGFPVCYREHVDYRKGSRDASLLRGREVFWTDNGVYSWATEQEKWCYELTVKTEQRIVLRTPQLAGRIDHVKYSPLQHLRSPEPDSPYHYDGGVSTRAAGTTYAVWM